MPGHEAIVFMMDHDGSQVAPGYVNGHVDTADMQQSTRIYIQSALWTKLNSLAQLWSLGGGCQAGYGGMHSRSRDEAPRSDYRSSNLRACTTPPLHRLHTQVKHVYTAAGATLQRVSRVPHPLYSFSQALLYR